MTRRTPPERRSRAGARPAGGTGDPQAARAAALALLGRRDFASAELSGRLAAQGFAPELVASTLAELTRERSLDDERYAHNYVAYRSGRGHGPVRIASELRTLGIAAELIEAALGSGYDWTGLARAARQRRFGASPPGSWSEKARQARFLQYRGFSADHIRSALGAEIDPDELP